MKKAIFIVAAAAVLITGSMLVIAQKDDAPHAGPGFDRGHGGPGFGRDHDGPGFHGGPGAGLPLKALDLTDEQKAKVREIMDASRANVEAIMEQMKASHEKLASLGTDGKFDEAAVTTAATEQGNLTARLIVEKERVKSQIFGILTDAQKTKAAEMRTQFEERMKARGTEGGRPAPPKSDL